ncbi:MAG TPA: lipoprotein-releasing ABC transporter permease subunit [Pseudomonadales bacterium]|nr:lipoprotein-releasing ABC transporter permease subunit [Pseudomonadales bacterium]
MSAEGQAPVRGLSALAGHPIWFIAVRYLGAVRRTRGISFISVVSVLGLTLGVAALVTVLSVMNGFDRELRTRILGVVPHVLVRPEVATRERLEALRGELEQVPGVRAVVRFAQVRGMVTTGERVLPVAVVGIEPEREGDLSPVQQAMVMGGLADLDDRDGVLLGAPLASRLGLFPGDRVTFLLPRAADDSVRPELLTAGIRGLFRLGAEPDHGLVFMDVDALMRRPGIATEELRIVLDDLFEAPAVAARLRARFGDGVRVSDWTDRYGELFDAVGMEKTMMGLLLGLIVAIAVFNIVASLAMVVDEKRGAIAILRTLGASRGEIVRIFVLQGALVGVAGIVAGVLLGVVLALNIGDVMHLAEQAFGFRLLAGTYFDRLPSVLLLMDVVWIAALALCLALGGALYPALRAGRVDPAPALHGL